ncbi:uncharacterized protein LOC120344470 [Styela clava]
MQACSFCGIKEKIMKRCVQCRIVFYCSRKCQIDDWKTHKLCCVKFESSNNNGKFNEDSQKIVENKLTDIIQFPNASISVKCNHKKHEILLQNVDSCSGEELMENISKKLKIPLTSLKLIAKGKLVKESNISEMLSKQKCKNFQAFGEEAENEDGLDLGDIEAIINELHVSRNQAIRSLRSCNGDLIDAIIELGNKI